jgi:hypothetical protein
MITSFEEELFFNDPVGERSIAHCSRADDFTITLYESGVLPRHVRKDELTRIRIFVKSSGVEKKSIIPWISFSFSIQHKGYRSLIVSLRICDFKNK